MATHCKTRRARRGRLSFGLAALMGVMLLCAVMSAILGGLLRSPSGQQYFYVLAAIATPMGAMILASMLWRLLAARRKSTRKPSGGDDPFA